MTVPFMRQYTERLVRICHKHNAHAMGGMSAFIPSRKDPEINRVATEKVSQDKEREVGDGFDGTWVAHPDLVKLAKDIFVKGLQGKANQVHRYDKWLLKFVYSIRLHWLSAGKKIKGGGDHWSLFLKNRLLFLLFFFIFFLIQRGETRF